LRPRRRVETGAVGDLRDPLDGVLRGEELPRRVAQHLLLVGEREIHRLFGSPRTRSAMMLRRISEVPPSIVFPRERSCWRCQEPSSIACSPPESIAYGPSISSASLVRRWFVSDHTSFAVESSGPGIPVCRNFENDR